MACEDLRANFEAEHLGVHVVGSSQLQASQRPLVGLVVTAECVQRLTKLALLCREPRALSQLLEFFHALSGDMLSSFEVPCQRLDLPCRLHRYGGEHCHPPFAE